jgi:Tol biopolymer transport system component/DNA-binding winged helix-turn-helix (wHTH) protein
MIQQIGHFYEFGSYRLDIRERILLRDGHHVPLPPKALETLIVLVENSGHILEKDELLKRVWPDTFVEEGNLAKKISDLRKILGEEQSDHYIETIPKRGYRFVAPVREVWDDHSDPMIFPGGTPAVLSLEERTKGQEKAVKPSFDFDVYPTPAVPVTPLVLPRSFLSRLKWPAILLTLVLLISAILWLTVLRGGVKPSVPPLKIIPFTSFQGSETHAAFSADGNQVAFVWGGEKGDNQDIYVKLIGTGQPLRLTTNPAADTHPTWSPDGRTVAFFRQSPESSGFYLIPALGGSERKVAEVFPYRTLAPGNSQYYSPDGKYLAIADKTSQEEPFSLFLLSIETGEKKKLTSPPVGTVGDSYPAFSPDGKMLAFMRSSSSATTDLYLLPLTGGGQPQQLTFDTTSIFGITWTADGREIIFSSRRGSSICNLWRIPATGGAPERLPTIGQNVVSPAISRQGDRLVYTQALDETNIWRLPLDGTGKGGVATSIISSTLADNGPDYSPDGQKIVFASNRSGDFGLWVCDRNGANPMPLIESGPYLTGTPRWSPDGRWIAFDSRSSTDPKGNADIYVISAEGGQPRRLTEEPFEDVTPSWSRDSKWIYFGSTRSGSMQIWKVPVEGGQAVQVTRNGGFEGFESLDSTYFYYAKGRAVPGIWQVPVGGGEETLLLDHHQAGYWRLWTVTEKGIYFATANMPAQPVIEFFNFATRKITPVATLDKPISRSDPGIAISPDRRWLLFAQMDQSGSDVMLVENFH